MNSPAVTEKAITLVLRAQTAADLMQNCPHSISRDATVQHAAAFLVEKEISGAPVIDEAGRPVGVLTQTDLIRRQTDAQAKRADESEYYKIAGYLCPPALREAFFGHPEKHVLVRDIMSPVVISVLPTDSACTVVAELLALKIHRLFVVDQTKVLVGVITTFDVLRALERSA